MISCWGKFFVFFITYSLLKCHQSFCFFSWGRMNKFSFLFQIGHYFLILLNISSHCNSSHSAHSRSKRGHKKKSLVNHLSNSHALPFCIYTTHHVKRTVNNFDTFLPMPAISRILETELLGLYSTVICVGSFSCIIMTILHVLFLLAFYVSFVVTPLCSNASELVSSLIFASKKKKENVSMTFAQVILMFLSLKHSPHNFVKRKNL